MKKIVSLVTAIILLLSVAVNGVVFAQANPELVVSNVTGYIGDQVEIKVQLKNSPGFGGMAYDVKYDNTKLKLISYETDLGKSICTDSGKDRYPDKMNFQYAGTSNIEGDGVLVSFIFEILDVAPGATNITVIPQIGTTFYYVGHTETDFTLDNASGSITIKTRPVPVTGIALNKVTASIGTSESLTLTPIFSPETATNKNVTWSSSDKTIATVENGIVTPFKKGTTTITVTTEDGGFSASCVVTVNCSHLNTTDVPAEDSTCIKHGHKAYTICNDCREITRGSNSELPLGDHIGGTATCVKKAVCDVCHKEYGNLAAHKYGETVKADYLKTAATCGSKAVYYKSCSICGIQSEETFETGDYDYTNHIGETYLKNQKEATCYNEGYTGDTYCRTCDKEISKGQPIAKSAHNPASVWTTDETSHWKECQTVGCGNIIDKAAHSGGEATCVNKAICSVCKVEYGAIDPSNHKHTEVRNAKDATCCEKGYTGDTWCTDCSTKISSGSDIPATGKHTDADGKWETDGKNHWRTCYFGTKFDISAHSGGEATCISKANCSVCGAEYGNLDTSNHKHTEVRNAKEATCCEKGYTGDTWCTDCSTKISSGSDIPATGKHTDADGKWETDGTNHWHTCYFGTRFDVTAHSGGEATCIHKAVCAVCQTAYGTVNASIHKGTTYLKDQKEPSCYEEGYTGDTYCSDCNVKIKDGTVIAKTAHNPASVWTTDATHHWKVCEVIGCGNLIDKAAHTGGEATCISQAICSVCGVKYGEKNPANHTGGTEIKDAFEAKCNTEGYTGDTYCKGCGVKISDGKATAKIPHVVTEWTVTKEATTESTGTKSGKCNGCGETITVTTAKLVSEIKKDNIEGIDATIEGVGETNLSEDVIFEANNVTETITAPEKAKVENSIKALTEFANQKIGAIFDLGLILRETSDNGDVIAETKLVLTGNVKVTIPVPTDLTENLTDLKLLHIKDDGTVEEVPFTLSGGKATFETDGFSYYTFVGTEKTTNEGTNNQTPSNNETNKSPATGDNSNIIFWSLISVISLAVLCITGLIFKKKIVR